MYHSFLIHSSADGHLGCFHVLAKQCCDERWGTCVSFNSGFLGFLYFRFKTNKHVSHLTTVVLDMGGIFLSWAHSHSALNVALVRFALAPQFPTPVRGVGL